MDLVIKILTTAFGILIAYFVLERILPNTGKPFYKTFMKYLLGFFILAVGFEFLGRVFISEPKIITATMEQLKANAEIRREIGIISGYSYNKNELIKTTEYPKEITCELFGSKGEVLAIVKIDSAEGVFEVINFEIKPIE